VVAIGADGHVAASWLSGAAMKALRDFNLHRDAEGQVYGKGTDTPAGRRPSKADLAELRRLWLAIFDARFGGKS
jgi:hypothetical protein